MEKVNLTKEFAYRLRDAMLASGYSSQRSVYGVDIHKLAEITGYSLQISRKYLRGEALPDPFKILEIAHKLNVHPGWLLFGQPQDHSCANNEDVFIKKNLLYYIFTKAECLFKDNLLKHEAPNFLIDLINDISLINADIEQSKKIIDLAFSSLRHFNKITKD